MWDFMRDLGETNVGGAAVIKSAQDNNTGFELQSITQIRLHNIAKAYGWWIAKDSVSLLVLKVCMNFFD
jgi:nucleolar MIF4G domain-containing protein 1